MSEAENIALENGNINYILFFKKDSKTMKYIVYFEPEYKRVIEIKSSTFIIGNTFVAMDKDSQINDPYFRKADNYVRKSHDSLSAASISHSESLAEGSKITFRTVYIAEGRSYRSSA